MLAKRIQMEARKQVGAPADPAARASDRANEAQSDVRAHRYCESSACVKSSGVGNDAVDPPFNRLARKGEWSGHDQEEKSGAAEMPYQGAADLDARLARSRATV